MVKYMHVRSKGIYEVLYFGFSEINMEPVVIYRDSDDIVFVRSIHTFFDGRFELVKKV